MIVPIENGDIPAIAMLVYQRVMIYNNLISPLRIGLWDPFLKISTKMAYIWGVTKGGLYRDYKLILR